MNVGACDEDYRGGLGREELLAELRSLLRRERAIERLICRYLADLADSVERDPRVLGSYADVYHLVRNELGLGRRQARERIRVGRALRQLPAIEEAFLGRELSYSRAREVTRVAEPHDEHRWLAAAKALPMRELERRVVEAGGGPTDDRRREAEPMETRHVTPDVVEMRLMVPAETLALLERAMEGAKRMSGTSMSDAEALAAVARDALARQDDGEADPRRTVVIYECGTCGRAELETGAAPVELAPGEAATLGCGAKEVDLKRAGRVVKRGGRLPAAVRNAVLLRDRSRCRVPGCHLRRYVDVHHVQAQSRGGEHSRRNCVTLCGRHHQWLHEGKLRIEGDADGELAVYDEDGTLMVDPMGATQGGSPGAGSTSGVVLEAMGRRGGWTVDRLCDATRLSAQAVSVALTELQLDGWVEVDVYGRFGRSERGRPVGRRGQVGVEGPPPRAG